MVHCAPLNSLCPSLHRCQANLPSLRGRKGATVGHPGLASCWMLLHAFVNPRVPSTATRAERGHGLSSHPSQPSSDESIPLGETDDQAPKMKTKVSTLISNHSLAPRLFLLWPQAATETYRALELSSPNESGPLRAELGCKIFPLVPSSACGRPPSSPLEAKERD